MQESIELEINAAILSVMALFTAYHNDIRYYLHGIHIHPCTNGKGAIIEATNGHQAAIWLDKTGHVSEPIIIAPSKGLIAASKQSAPKGRLIVERKLRLVNNQLVMFNGEEEAFIQPGNPFLDGKFPELARVIPSTDRFTLQENNHLNHNLVTTITKAAAQIIKLQRFLDIQIPDYSLPIKTRSTSGKGASVTRFAGVDDFLILTMPISTKGATAIIDDADPIGTMIRNAYPVAQQEAANDKHEEVAA